MNDRFKLRLWESKFKEMTYIYDYVYFEERGMKTPCDFLPDVIPMQCTGLKDKNGKLIYEWDIVKFKDVYRTYRQGTIKYTNEDALFCLSYIDKSNKKDWDYVSRYRLEVIGNIYENKELLNER